MYSWLVGRVVRLLVKRLNSGDVRFVLATFGPDACLVFPGSSSFAGDHRGKPAIRAWLERFTALGPSLTVHDVAVAGAPWNMRVSFRFSDEIPIPSGGWRATTGCASRAGSAWKDLAARKPTIQSSTHSDN